MRLKSTDITIIKKVISSVISDAAIFLFGSRVDDTKKGGDIDLFVKTAKNITLKEELSILTQLELSGIHRKIDLIIETPHKNKEIFFKTIKERAILL